MREKKLKSKEIFTCSFMTLYEDDVRTDSGIETKRVYIKHPGAAAILPITKDGKIILTKQFRYPIYDISLEIPAGKKDSIDEDPYTCALRELEEETGYISTDIEHLYTIYPCLGYSDEIIDIYLARDCVKKDNPLPQDADEQIEIIFYNEMELLELLKQKKIRDGKTIIALQHYLLLNKQLNK